MPGAPTGVTAAAHRNAQSVVSWTAPASNGGAPITNYTVTSLAGGPRPAPPAPTSCTVTGLTNGDQLHLHGDRHQRLGHRRRPRRRRRPIIPATTPGAPTNVTATNHANSQSAVSWTAPASNGGSAITGYTVTSSGWPDLHHHRGHHLHGDRADQRHRLHLHGHGHQQRRDRTGVGAVGRRHPATLPGAPTGVDGRLEPDSQSPVTWTAPASNGGLPITSLHGDLQPRWQDLHATGGDQLHGDRSDQRHQLHLHRDRHQRRRHRAGVGPLRTRPFRRPPRARPPA